MQWISAAHSFKAETPFFSLLILLDMCAVSWGFIWEMPSGRWTNTEFALDPYPTNPNKTNPHETPPRGSIYPGFNANWPPFAQICTNHKFDCICISVTFLETGVSVKTLCPKLQNGNFCNIPWNEIIWSPRKIKVCRWFVDRRAHWKIYLGRCHLVLLFGPDLHPVLSK